MSYTYCYKINSHQMIRKGSKYTFKRVELSILLFKLVSRPDIFLLQYHKHLVDFFPFSLLRKKCGVGIKNSQWLEPNVLYQNECGLASILRLLPAGNRRPRGPLSMQPIKYLFTSIRLVWHLRAIVRIKSNHQCMLFLPY